MLNEGFQHVEAVDQEAIGQIFADTFPKDRFEYIISKMENLELKEGEYDLINAQFSLPFIKPGSFSPIISNLIRALKKKGILTGQFFGINDEWRDNTNMTFVTKDRALELLNGLELLHFQETEEDGQTAAKNTKHWHVFNFIAKK